MRLALAWFRRAEEKSRCVTQSADDVAGDSLTNPIAWSFDTFYTWHDFIDADIDRMKLTDREYQAIGENLVARLMALNGRLK